MSSRSSESVGSAAGGVGSGGGVGRAPDIGGVGRVSADVRGSSDGRSGCAPTRLTHVASSWQKLVVFEAHSSTSTHMPTWFMPTTTAPLVASLPLPLLLLTIPAGQSHR